MKCPKCGFENRPEARFCKQCGQPLQAQAAPQKPPTRPGIVCPACGATAKPGAGFCPRCGKPLPAAPAPPTPPPAQPVAYAQPPSQPPPPTAPSTPKRHFPRWVWWGGGTIAFLCIVALVVTAALLGSKFLSTEEEPAPPPTPTQWLPVEATPPAAPPTEPPATGTPTAVPPTEIPPAEAPTEAPPPPAFGAQVGIVPSTTELRAGELLTVTVTVANTGQVTFGALRYQLLGEWEPYLRATAGAAVEHEPDVMPGQSDTATFVLEAAQAGTARLQANVTMKTREEPPSLEPASSEHVEVSVIQ
jgi:hypothetical protein